MDGFRDEIDRFLVFAEQLEQAALLIGSDTIARLRISIVALDNLAEVLLQAHVRHRFEASERSWWSDHRRFPRSERTKILGDFTAKVTLAAERADVPFVPKDPLLTDADAALFRIAHAYRNGIYHEDRHPPALLAPLAKLYLAAVGRAWERSFPQGYGTGSPGMHERVSSLARFGYTPSDTNCGVPPLRWTRFD